MKYECHVSGNISKSLYLLPQPLLEDQIRNVSNAAVAEGAISNAVYIACYCIPMTMKVRAQSCDTRYSTIFNQSRYAVLKTHYVTISLYCDILVRFVHHDAPWNILYCSSRVIDVSAGEEKLKICLTTQ